MNRRGQQAATRMGRHLRDQEIEPELVLCSSALRTRQTLERLFLDAEVPVHVEDDLYGASAEELLARLRQVDDSVTSVLLIAHNFGLEDLAIALSGEQDRLAPFPTAALADLRVPIPAWNDLRPGIAVLHGFVIPRELP